MRHWIIIVIITSVFFFLMEMDGVKSPFLTLCVCYRATLLCEWAAYGTNHQLFAAAYWWELHTITLTETHYIFHHLSLAFSTFLSVLDGNGTAEPSILLPSLSLLLFLVPMVAVAVGVLLWRRGPCTFPQSQFCHLSFLALFWILAAHPDGSG